MRFAFLILVGLIAGATTDTARADQYKWCAIMGGDDGDFKNCYFVTLQQCQAAVSGNGGFCMPSFYDSQGRPISTMPASAPPKKKKS